MAVSKLANNLRPGILPSMKALSSKVWKHLDPAARTAHILRTSDFGTRAGNNIRTSRYALSKELREVEQQQKMPIHSTGWMWLDNGRRCRQLNPNRHTLWEFVICVEAVESWACRHLDCPKSPGWWKHQKLNDNSLSNSFNQLRRYVRKASPSDITDTHRRLRWCQSNVYPSHPLLMSKC